METSFKLTKVIQVILITVLLVLIAIITVGKLSNNKIIATEVANECPNCETKEKNINGDVTGDGKVDFKDLVKLNRYRLNKITEL